MPRRGAAGSSTKAAASEDENAPPLTEQSVLDFICKSVCSNEHWRPSKSLARCLGVPFARLLLTTRKEDATNLVWTTVLVLSYCATTLADHHEQWYEVGDTTSAWLYKQMHFVEHREDLVRSACSLLGIRDASTLLATLFAEPKDAEALAMEAVLGDWKALYLQEPPYTQYFWNEKTNHSTWRNPLETAKQQQELLEKKKHKEAILAKALRQRLKINRDRVNEVQLPGRFCDECDAKQTGGGDGENKRDAAQVLCLDCGSKYFCSACCDKVHCDRLKLSHCETGFRFVECCGINGFPRISQRMALPVVPKAHSDVVA